MRRNESLKNVEREREREIGWQKGALRLHEGESSARNN